MLDGLRMAARSACRSDGGLATSAGKFAGGGGGGGGAADFRCAGWGEGVADGDRPKSRVEDRGSENGIGAPACDDLPVLGAEAAMSP